MERLRMAFAGTLLICLCACNDPQQRLDVVVRGFSWAQSIRIYITETKTEESWSLPVGAIILKQVSKFHHKETVRDYYGPGMCYDFKKGFVFCMEWHYKQVPVEKPWYTYQIDRERLSRTVVATGKGREPYWPTVTLEWRERKGENIGVYHSLFAAADGRVYTYETSDAADWLQHANSRLPYYGKVDTDGMKVACFTEPPQTH